LPRKKTKRKAKKAATKAEDEKVPEITFKAFGYEQVPQLNMQGSDFPIAIVR